MSKPAKTERNKRICELRGKLPASEIAKIVGCSRNAVIGVWWRAGLCKEAPILAKSQRSSADDLATIKPFVLKTAERLGYEAAAKQWGFHPTTVWKWMRETSA